MTAGSGPAPGAGSASTELAQMQTPVEVTSPAGTAEVDHGQSQTTPAEEQITILAVLLGVLAGMVLGFGFWFSVRELRRLSGEGELATRRVHSSVEGGRRIDVELAA